MAKKISKVLASQRDYVLRPFALANHTHPADYPPVVADLTERDAISGDQRYEGVIIYVQSDQTTYQLRGGATNGDWITLVTATGVASHTELGDIGTNTHAQIDSHIADGTLHFTQASISITESQISDLQSYALASHNHDATYLGLTDAAVSTNALESATSRVSIVGSAEPKPGEVLVAINSTSAEWQTIFAAGGGDGDLVQVGSPLDTYVAYFTADKNISGDEGLTWIPGIKELTIKDPVNTASQVISSINFTDNIDQVVGQIGYTAVGADMVINNTFGTISLNPIANEAVIIGNSGNLEVGGWITSYGGATPADGSTLRWNTTNSRAEFSTQSAVEYGGFDHNVNGHDVALWDYNSTTEILGIIAGQFSWENGHLSSFNDGTGALNSRWSSWSLNGTKLILNAQSSLVPETQPGVSVRGKDGASPFYELTTFDTQIRYQMILRYNDTSDRVDFSSLSDNIMLRPGNVDTYNFTQALLTAGNYLLDVNQTVGASEDKYALTYDNGTGEISLAQAYVGDIAQNQVAFGAPVSNYIQGTSDFRYFPTSSQIRLDGTLPALLTYENDAALDQKAWSLEMGSGAVQYRRVYTDDFVTFNYDYEQVTRSGTGTGVQVDTIIWDTETSFTWNIAGTSMVWNGNLLTVGDGTDANTGVAINASATGNPNLQFQRNGVLAAFIEWNIADDDLWIDSDNDIVMRPSNTEVQRFASTIVTQYVPTHTKRATQLADYWYETDATLDQGWWNFFVSGEQAERRIYSDAFTDTYVYEVVSRSGTGAGVQVDSIDWSSAIDMTWTTDDATMTLGLAGEFWITSAGNMSVRMGASDVSTSNATLIMDAGSLGDTTISFEQNNVQKGYINRSNGDFLRISDDVLLQLAIDGTPQVQINTTQINLGTMVFNTDQVIGAGQDNYLLTYDDTGGEISLEAFPGVFSTGTPADNQIAVWTAADTIEGATGFEIDGTNLTVPSGAKIILNGAVGTSYIDYSSSRVNIFHLGTQTHSIGSNDTITLTNSNTFGDDGSSVNMYFDNSATGDTFFRFRAVNIEEANIQWDSSAQEIILDIGGTDAFRLAETTLRLSTALIIPTNTFLYFDGGDNTYMRENVADSIQITTGGTVSLTLTSTLMTTPADIQLSDSGKLQWGGSTTYIDGSQAAQQVQVYVNSVQAARFGSTLATIYTPLNTAASTASEAGLNILPGVAPTVPTDGDIWVTTGAAGSIFAQQDGTTYDLATGDVNKSGTQALYNVALWQNDTGDLGGDTSLQYNQTTDILVLTSSTTGAGFQHFSSSQTATYSDIGVVTTGVADYWRVQIEASEIFRVDAAGVDITGDLSVPQGNNIYLDGGGDTYIDSQTVNEIDFTMGNVKAVTFTSAGIEWQGQAYGNQQTLTQATTIAWNCNTGMSAVTTMTGNRTLGAPTNQKAGATYVLRIIQDATGTRTLAYNAVFKFPGGIAPVLSTGAADIDILTCVSDGTNMYCVLNKDFT